MKYVKDVMARNPDFLGIDDNIRHAARLMRDGDYGSLPVVDARNVGDSGVLVGIVTDRDIVIKAVAEGLDGSASVRQCMTSDPDVVSADTPLDQAMIVMTSRQVRRLPVVENGRLIGMIALGDIAGSATSADEKARALEDISSGDERRPAGTAFDA